MTGRAAAVVLLDIEGTIAPLSYVREVLFPFARRELAAFLQRTWERPDVIAARRQVAADAGGAAVADRALLIEHLLGLMDRDAKAAGLKQLQGLIWEEGFVGGILRSQVFADVPPALRRWRAAGVRVAIFSSGSVAAQRLFVRFSEHGDLSALIDGFFDTTHGPKQAAASYTQIAAALETPPAGVLFISDVPTELEAAAAAGMQVLLAERPGNRPTGDVAFERVRDFAALHVERGA